MFDIERISEWRGQDVVDPEGQRVGRLEEVYCDNYGSSPGFACVKTGLFGRRLTFVPLAGASMGRDHVRVAYPADQIKHAPSVEPDGALSADEEAALFDYYALDSSPVPGAELGAQPGSELAPAPRLMRYHTEAAAAHLAQAQELAAQDVAGARGLGADRDARHGDLGLDESAGGAMDARLRALEARIEELENWRGR